MAKHRNGVIPRLHDLIDEGLTQPDLVEVMHNRFDGATQAEIARVRDEFSFAIDRGKHNVAVDDGALASRDAEGGMWAQGWLWIRDDPE
jgi:hypothetical protein